MEINRLDMFGAGRLAVFTGEKAKAAYPGVNYWRHRGNVDRNSGQMDTSPPPRVADRLSGSPIGSLPLG